MASDHDRDRRLARQGRIAAVVIALSGLVALLAPWFTARLGLTVRHEMLFYLASLGGFAWALVVTVTIWRARRGK
jgi:hypothetical protein